METVKVVKVFTAWIEQSCGEDVKAVIVVDWLNRCYLHNHKSEFLDEHKELAGKIEAKGEINLAHWLEIPNGGDRAKGEVKFDSRLFNWHCFETDVKLECKHPTAFEDRCTSCSQWIN